MPDRSDQGRVAAARGKKKEKPHKIPCPKREKKKKGGKKTGPAGHLLLPRKLPPQKKEKKQRGIEKGGGGLITGTPSPREEKEPSGGGKGTKTSSHSFLYPFTEGRPASKKREGG